MFLARRFTSILSRQKATTFCTNGKKDKMKTKLLPLVVSVFVALCFGLIGCSGSSGTSTQASSEPTAQEESSATEEAAAAEEPEAPTEEATEAKTEPEPEPEPEPEASNTTYDISIDGVRLAQDWEGNEIAVVAYTWTNNSEDTTSFATALYAKVFQNGVECDNLVLADDIDNDGYMADVKPGGTVSFEHGYAIKDHSEITVEVTELFSLSKDILAEATLTLE